MAASEAGREEANRVLGARVSEARKARGLSQRLLAEKAGLGRDAVRRLEGGKSKAHNSTIMAVAAALGVEVEDLLPEGEGFAPPMTPPEPGAPSSSPQPAAPAQAQRPGRRAGEGYITVYVADRSLEEVLEEVRERYEDKILAARARAALAEDPEPEEDPEAEHFEPGGRD